jgi:hypothetical protein
MRLPTCVRLILVVAVGLTIIWSPAAEYALVRARPAPATPRATRASEELPLYTAWVAEAASRYWQTPLASLGEWPYDVLAASAFRFDTVEHARAAVDLIVLDRFAGGPGTPLTYDQLRRVAATPIAEDSQVWTALATSREGISFSIVVLAFRTGDRVVVLHAASFRDPNAVDLPFMIADVIRIAQALADRTPSNQPPDAEGSITVGGLFDVLPGFADVPPGFMLLAEDSAPAGQVVPPTG